MKCREALLALARENRSGTWIGDVDDPPKGDDLKGRMTLFAAKLLPDRRQRAYLKEVTDKAWDVTVGLQPQYQRNPMGRRVDAQRR